MTMTQWASSALAVGQWCSEPRHIGPVVLWTKTQWAVAQLFSGPIHRGSVVLWSKTQWASSAVGQDTVVQ